MPWFTGWMWPSAAVGHGWLNLGPTLVKVLVLPALRTPLFLLWRSRGATGRVRTTPGALPTAAASMDGSDGRPDGRPGVGKGLKRGLGPRRLVQRRGPVLAAGRPSICQNGDIANNSNDAVPTWPTAQPVQGVWREQYL